MQRSGWIVKERDPEPGEIEGEVHVMPAKQVPPYFLSVAEAQSYVRDLRRAGSPLVRFNGKLWAYWGHKPSQDCECEPELRMENGRGVWVHKHPN